MCPPTSKTSPNPGLLIINHARQNSFQLSWILLVLHLKAPDFPSPFHSQLQFRDMLKDVLSLICLWTLSIVKK